MKIFVIFGCIEFTDGIAYVYETQHAEFIEEDDAEKRADELKCDWLAPHYYGGETIFHKFHKETT